MGGRSDDGNTDRARSTRARKNTRRMPQPATEQQSSCMGPARPLLRHRPEPQPGITAATDGGAEPRRQKQYFLTDASELV